jgi:hypothetical protein
VFVNKNVILVQLSLSVCFLALSFLLHDLSYHIYSSNRTGYRTNPKIRRQRLHKSAACQIGTFPSRRFSCFGKYRGGKSWGKNSGLREIGYESCGKFWYISPPKNKKANEEKFTHLPNRECPFPLFLCVI